MMVAEPALRGEMPRAGAIAEAESAVAIDDRSALELKQDLDPTLVAAAVMAATHSAMARHLRTDPPAPIGGPARRRPRPDRGGAAHPLAIHW
jgi:hypothetical protein